MKSKSTYDVVICGGGLAGLTLARQLKLYQPERTIAVIDKQTGPLPNATHKVGESTVENGAYYLAEKLQLSNYFKSHHFPKFGLRFFFGNATEAFHQRPEFGLSQFPKVESYQIDRGLLEDQLRKRNNADGIALLEGMSVKDIRLAEDDSWHEIWFHDQARTQTQSIQARWVVDAMGRRRYLQKKLGLIKGKRGHCSAVWFRLAGRVDVNALTPAAHSQWHKRVPDENRYYSTNHLMGAGYWVWLIPLASGYTSVGIVTDENIHPFETYNQYSKAMAWLQSYEPVLAKHLQGHTPLDFKCMRRYSYSSKQLFSHQRWACVGEAGIFPDPFYSPGVDLIGFANTITAEMIRQDFQGTLIPETVTHYNRFLRGFNDTMKQTIQSGYPNFGNATVTAAKLLWDFTAGWALNSPQMFNDIYLDPKNHKIMRKKTADFFSLTRRMQRLFATWAAHSTERLTYTFVDYLSLEFLAKLRHRNLQTGKSFVELQADQEENMARLEELAQALFLLAVEDVMPEQLSAFSEPFWLNAWRVNLKPSTWKKGLFNPKTPPRDFSQMRYEIRSKFHLKEEAVS